MCNDCKGTGKIHLLTSTVDCACVVPNTVATDCPSLARDRQPDPACFGSIKGVTLNSCEVPIEGEPTYTIDIEQGTSRGRRFTGLSKSAVDFVHACLNAGWDADRVAEHLNEMATHQRVNDRQKQMETERCALGGFSMDEIEEGARNIQAALLRSASEITEDGEEEEIICRELVRMLIRRTLREVMTTGFPGPFAKGGVVSGERFRQECGFSFVPETCHRQSATEHQTAKAEVYRRMYGGVPNLQIDTSQVELRMLAHLHNRREERKHGPIDPDTGLPHRL